MMRATRYLLLIFALICAAAADAQTLFPEDPDLGKWSLDLSLSPVGVDGADESAKFTEYRDVPNGAWSDLHATYRNQTQMFSASAHNIGLDDQQYHLRFDSYGNYRAQFLWDQIPHRYAFDARTLFTGIGSGSLELDDNIQSTLQNTPDPVAAAALLNGFLQNATLFDEETIRKKALVNFDLFLLQPFQLKAEYKHENRTGTRPFSGAFSFANIAELAMPIDYNTNEVRVGGEYASEAFYLNASYYLSVFENNITSLSFDNPWRITDFTLPEEPAIFLTSIGASQGIIDLFPSNDYQNFAFTAAYRKLPWKAQLSGVFSWGFLRQDDPLLPFTTNTAIVPGGPGNPPYAPADPSTLPATVVKNRMDTPHIQVNYTARPGKKVQLRAQYRYDALNNDSEPFTIPGYVALDNYWRGNRTPGAVNTNLPIAYDTNNLAFDFIYQLTQRTQFNAGYTYERTNREFREVAELTDNRFRLGLDSRVNDELDVRVSYERSNREGDSYQFGQSFLNRGELAVTILPWLRKFDQANRNRDDFKILASYHPGDRLTLSGSVLYGKDDFTKDQTNAVGVPGGFGLLDDSHTVYTVDASYALAERFDVNGYYAFETYETNQQSRTWLPFGPGDPFFVEPGLQSGNNWSAKNTDDVNTFGAGFHAALVPGKWDVKFQLTYSKSDGNVDFASTIAPPLDLHPYTPGSIQELDDVTRWVVMPEVKYQARENCSIAFGYWYDSYDITDYAVTGFMNVPVLPNGAFNGALLMGTLPRDYSANVFYVTLAYRL